ncbi:MAG: hypothetical protein KDC10_15515 [Calditrichaeota bacterium]|nr:hypothetical protein [Calditrichota bacterium]MCB9474570.1 hypothetical protein [Candidatus Delongbacteria bacterium]
MKSILPEAIERLQGLKRAQGSTAEFQQELNEIIHMLVEFDSVQRMGETCQERKIILKLVEKIAWYMLLRQSEIGGLVSELVKKL